MSEQQLQLEPWDEGDAAPPIPLTIKTQATRIDIDTPDGRAIWIEQQDGVVLVHGYIEGVDEPVNLRLGPDSLKVDSDYRGFMESEIQP